METYSYIHPFGLALGPEEQILACIVQRRLQQSDYQAKGPQEMTCFAYSLAVLSA